MIVKLYFDTHDGVWCRKENQNALDTHELYKYIIDAPPLALPLYVCRMGDFYVLRFGGTKIHNIHSKARERERVRMCDSWQSIRMANFLFPIIYSIYFVWFIFFRLWRAQVDICHWFQCGLSGIKCDAMPRNADCTAYRSERSNNSKLIFTIGQWPLNISRIRSGFCDAMQKLAHTYSLLLRSFRQQFSVRCSVQFIVNAEFFYLFFRFCLSQTLFFAHFSWLVYGS